MKRLRKSIGIGLSIFLLLCFSVTILPWDAFHNHQPISTTSKTPIPCKDFSGKTCSHKAHLSVKSNYCWVCAIHYDKTFTKSTVPEKSALSPAISVLIDNRVTGYLAELLFSTLRGPPQE